MVKPPEEKSDFRSRLSEPQQFALTKVDRVHEIDGELRMILQQIEEEKSKRRNFKNDLETFGDNIGKQSDDSIKKLFVCGLKKSTLGKIGCGFFGLMIIPSFIYGCCVISSKKSNGVVGFAIASSFLILALCCISYAIFNDRADAKTRNDIDKIMDSKEKEIDKLLMSDEAFQALVARGKELVAFREDLVQSAKADVEDWRKAL